MQVNLGYENFEDEDPELLGLWFTWESKVKGYMKKAGKKSLAGKNINTALVKNLQKQYTVLMNSGYSPPTYSKKSGYAVDWNPSAYQVANKLGSVVGTSKIKTLNFLQAVTYLSSIGKIPFSIYNPVKAKETKLAMQANKIPNVFTKLTSNITGTAKMIPIAALGLAAFGIVLLTKKKE